MIECKNCNAKFQEEDIRYWNTGVGNFIDILFSIVTLILWFLLLYLAYDNIISIIETIIGVIILWYIGSNSDDIVDKISPKIQHCPACKKPL